MTDRLKQGSRGRLSRLNARYLGDGRWQLELDLYYNHNSGLITVPDGFVTDFDSVPRIPIAYLFTNGRAKASAVVHDFLYKTGKLNGKRITRKQADLIFYDAMAHEGLAWRHKALIYAGVRAGGWRAWGKHRKAEA